MSAEDVSKQEAKDPSSARLIITLSLAGFFSGLILVGIYEVTLPTITANQARELREAVFKVLPGVARMEAMAWVNDSLQPSEGEGDDSEIADGLRRLRQFRTRWWAMRYQPTDRDFKTRFDSSTATNPTSG